MENVPAANQRFGVLSSGDKNTSTISSNFSFGNLGIQLPKMELEAFRNSLLFFNDYKNTGKFFFMKSLIKNAAIEFGFCEIQQEEKKCKNAKLTKFYIPRVYRKMKMIIPISICLFNYLFRIENLEKLTLDIISESETLQVEMQVVGFRLERVILMNGKKYKTYCLKKSDFYDFLDEMLPDMMNQKHVMIQG